jgi:transcriptional regulator GlxA family with amidase domain
VTICSGTLLAGARRAARQPALHDAPRAAAHAARAGAAREGDRQPRLRRGRPIASSAGITAGIDVALHLIAEECGEAAGGERRRDMVVYLGGRIAIRSSRRSHASRASAPDRASRAGRHRRRARARLDMAALARAGHTTERHLLRLFIEHAGVSPLQYLQAIRLERARQALEHGASVTRRRSRRVPSDLQMRRAWSRQWGGTPRDALKDASKPERGPVSAAPVGTS